MNQPVLHRDDPDQEPLVGNIKVTRQDWLNAAMDVLISDGVDRVKVMPLADRLNVSRSSFYWYFKDRQDLLNALLDEWQSTNTAALVRAAGKDASTITQAVGNVFIGFLDARAFNTALDFAVRDWARRASAVKQVLDASDARRIEALAAMFVRFGYEPLESQTRARVLYYMQIGYNDADLREPLEDRLRQMAPYLQAFTGQIAPDEEIANLHAVIRQLTVNE